MNLYLRRILLLLLPLGMALGARAQATLVEETFATDGEGARYNSNSAALNAQLAFGANQYFVRATSNPFQYIAGTPSFGSTANPITIFSTKTPTGAPTGAAPNGGQFWACEGVRGNVTTTADLRDAGTVTLVPLTVTNYTGLTLSVSLADARGPGSPAPQPTAETNDKIRIEYKMDSGPWTTVGLFMGFDPTTGTNWRQDTSVPLDESSADNPNAPVLTPTLTPYSFTIPVTGNSLQVRVVLDQRGSTEEVAFDDIKVTGTLSNVTPPTLTGIEPGTIIYYEGDPATQVTNTITAGNSGNLSGATVQIASGFINGQDVLSFTPSSLITRVGGGTSSTTGTLTLTGSATAAQYSAVLQTVKYQNLTVPSPTTGVRAVQFFVANGASTSATQTRSIQVYSTLNAPAGLTYTEDFETDGEGTRYTTNNFTTSVGLGYVRTNQNPPTTYSTNTFGGVNTAYYMYAEGVSNGNNPDTRRIGELILAPVNATGYKNLHFRIKIGAVTDQWDAGDYVKLYYRLNGNTGNWVQFGGFYNTQASSGPLKQDIDGDGVVDAAGVQLSTTMADVDFTLPPTLTGSPLDFRMEIHSDANEELAFDYIRISGTLVVAATVMTAAATSVTGTSAVLGGNVTADGGASVTERGVVYVAGAGTPTTSDTKLANGAGIGTYAQTVTGLRGNTLYTVRAYAINSVGTAYGNSQTFTTPNNPPTANADAVTVAENSGPTVINVLANDTSTPDINETLTVTAVTQPANGTATLTSGAVSFAPALSFNGTTSFTYTIADGNGGTATATVTVTVTPVNDAPVVTTTAGNTTFTRGAGAVAIDNGLTVTDVDNATLASASVSFAAGFVSGQDLLAFTPGNGLSGVYNNGTGLLTISGTSSVANYQAALRSVTYNNSSATPNTATRTLNFTANDGSLTSAVATKNVTFAATTTVVSITANGPSPTSASTVAYTVTFASTVTGVGASNFAVSVTNLTGPSVASVTGSGTTYVVTLNTGTLSNPSASGSIQLQFTNSTGVVPTITNPGLTGPAYVIDRTAPTATISSSAGASGSSTGTAPIPFTVTFSEAVTGFVAGDVTVTNGTITGNVVSGSGTTYTFTVTPTMAGTVTTVNVPTAVAQDAAGNFNTAAQAPYALTLSPTITLAPTTLPTGTQNVAYSTTLSASGGTAPYTYAITAGALPAGLSLSGNTISGTPTASGSFNFTVTATDNAAAPGPFSGSQAYTLAISALNSISWNGSVSTDWFNASNWTPNTVPTATIDATIPTSPSGGRFPAITSGAADVRNLSLNSGASLTQTGGTLALAASLTNNGTFQPSGGTVNLGGTALSNIVGSSTARFWNLTVGANGALLATSAGASVQRLLTLNGSFRTNGNSFILESNASGTAMVVNNGGNVVSGNATVQRYIDPSLNPNRGYRHFSSPIGTATVGSLATSGFSPVVNPNYNTSAQPSTVTPFPTVYGYDQARLATTTNNLPTFDKGWFSPSALSDPLAVGQGYTVNLAANQTFSLTGPLNNGNVALSLARNSGATAADAGLALVGNPYPSPLDWSQVDVASRPGLDGVIFVFQSNDPTNPYLGSYSFYNNGIGNISPVLPLGQGFFVRVSNDQNSATLTLKNSHRPTSYTNTAYRRTAAETRPLVQLTLKGAGSAVSDQAFVYFEQGATEGFDAQYDAAKLPNPNGLNLSTSVTGKQFSIDGRAEIGSVQRVIPLAVGVPAPGTYSLTAAELLNLAATPVYLRDVQLGTLTDLRLTPSYQFTVTNATALLTGRFELVFSPQQALATVPAALAQQVALYPNPAKKAAFVELPASLGRQAVTATFVDALGRQLRTVSLPAQGALAHQLDLTELATGVYALRLSTSAGVVVKKLVVE